MVTFPKNSCRWLRPGWPGKMIGSSFARSLKVQSTLKTPWPPAVAAPADGSSPTAPAACRAVGRVRPPIDPAGIAPWPAWDDGATTWSPLAVRDGAEAAATLAPPVAAAAAVRRTPNRAQVGSLGPRRPVAPDRAGPVTRAATSAVAVSVSGRFLVGGVDGLAARTAAWRRGMSAPTACGVSCRVRAGGALGDRGRFTPDRGWAVDPSRPSGRPGACVGAT